jgi:hypothetical protein
MTMKKEFALVNMQLSSFDSAMLILTWRNSDLHASLISCVFRRRNGGWGMTKWQHLMSVRAQNPIFPSETKIQSNLLILN